MALVKDSLLVLFSLNEVSNKDFARATKSALTVGALINQHPNKKTKNRSYYEVVVPKYSPWKCHEILMQPAGSQVAR